MFYPKNQEKELSDALFQNPTAEYRGAPFWAWSCELDAQEMLRQIDVFETMGFGGFHMHVRTGVDTKYLSDEFMGYIRTCVDRAKEKGMLAYLYDEDRWPSGAAGGYVTKDHEYRQRFLRFCPEPHPACDRLIACYDLMLDENGCLASYRRIMPNSICPRERILLTSRFTERGTIPLAPCICLTATLNGACGQQAGAARAMRGHTSIVSRNTVLSQRRS